MLVRSVPAVLVAAAVLFLASCKSERAAAPAPPAPGQSASPAAVTPPSREGGYGLRVEPQSATRRSTLMVSLEGQALQDVPIDWQVNGASESSSQPGRFDCSGSKRGDRIVAVAVVNGREVRSNEVVVGNTPPELRDVVLQPVTIAQGDSLAVSAASYDADDDKVTVQYAWTVNDVVAGNGESLGRALKRNDSVRVTVSAYDGQTYGENIVLSRTIANHPPVFSEHQDFTNSGGTVTYRARALDADGDQVTFSLASTVEGMSIDRMSGNVTWKVPDGFRGEQPVTIVVDDGHQGTEQYTVTFSIGE